VVANLVMSAVALTSMRCFWPQGQSAPSSLPINVFGILLGYLISQRAQSAFDRFIQAREQMSKLRALIVNFVTTVEHWMLANRTRKDVEQQLQSMCREQLVPYLYYRYRSLFCKTAKTESDGIKTWGILEAQCEIDLSYVLEQNKTFFSQSFYRDFDSEDSAAKMNLLRTMIMVSLMEANPLDASLWNQIEEAFRASENLGCHAGTVAGRILSSLTTLSLTLLSISMPILIYPSWGWWSWAPILVIIPTFSALDTFAALAENPFDDHITDINLVAELVSTVNEVKMVENVVKKVLCKAETLESTTSPMTEDTITPPGSASLSPGSTTDPSPSIARTMVRRLSSENISSGDQVMSKTPSNRWRFGRHRPLSLDSLDSAEAL